VINPTQALVPGFLLLAWISVVVILVAAPEVHARALRPSPRQPPSCGGRLRGLDLILPVIDFGQQSAFHPRRVGLACLRFDRRRTGAGHHHRRGRRPPATAWL